MKYNININKSYFNNHSRINVGSTVYVHLYIYVV